MRVAVLTASIYSLTTRFGMLGTSVAVVLALLSTVPIWAWRAGILLQVTPITLFLPSLGTACATGLMVLVIWLVKGLLEPGTLGLLVAGTGAGSLAYVVSLALLKPELKNGEWRQVSAMWRTP